MKKMSSKVIREPNNIFGENIKADGIRYVVNVTIDTAKEFHNCNYLYIRYVVDAPAGSKLSISDDIYYISIDFIHVEQKLSRVFSSIIRRLGIS